MTYYKALGFILCTLFLNSLLIGNALAAEVITTLPSVTKDNQVTLIQALQDRKSSRKFNDTEISPQLLGDLLWATWGVNRADGKHTIPIALNKPEILVYLALKDGVWLYEPKTHTLIQKSQNDVRSTMGSGTVFLIYAAPVNKFAAFHVGSLYQNAGLYCASVGLGNVVRMTVRKINDLIPLPEGYTIQMVQAVGYAK